jgi:hypothetical protein
MSFEIPSDFSAIDLPRESLDFVPNFESSMTRESAKARLITDRQKAVVERLIPELPQEKEYFHIISKGDFNYWQLACRLLDLIQEPCAFWCSIWTIIPVSIRELFAMYDAGKITRIRFLVGDSLRNRYPEVFAQLKDGIEARAEMLKIGMLHAKITVFHAQDSGRWFVMESSANYSTNPRIEQTTAMQSKAVGRFHADWISSAFSETVSEYEQSA